MDISILPAMDPTFALEKLTDHALLIGEPEVTADISALIQDYPTLNKDEIFLIWKNYVLADTLYGAACIFKFPDPVGLNNKLKDIFYSA
jgi:hypothetical protein